MTEFIQGNIAAAKSALANGLELYAGYPITPSTECMEYLAANMNPKKFINSFKESEATEILYGAAAMGARCMTATSGPGLSLMRESFSYAVGSRLPMVIYNVMRFGPGLGGISSSNEDISLSWGVGHGNSKVPILVPTTVQELADYIAHAFNIADQLRMPIFVMCDAVLGQMYESCEIHTNIKEYCKEWSLNKIYKNTITSRRISSYRLGVDEQKEYIESNIEREEKILPTLEDHLGNIMSYTEFTNGLYITGIGTVGRVVKESAEKLGIDYIIPKIILPVELKSPTVRRLTVVEVGGKQLSDIMRANYPKAEIRSIIFPNEIPSVEEIITKYNEGE